MDEFERLLCGCKGSVERFVYYKIPIRADAQDIIQDAFMTAYNKFDTLRDRQMFKSWLLRIARNKCSDYFRGKARQLEISLDALQETTIGCSCFGVTRQTTVQQTLEALGDTDKQILYLYFFKELPQAEIAKRLNIPLGTVKSRLHTAKQNFKKKYPYPPMTKGDNHMKLPSVMPEYKITKSTRQPFAVKWEETMGWFIIPKLGEKVSWAMYDIPSRKCDHIYDLEVTRPAEVHGIEGVEIIARESDCSDKADVIERTFVAQLTDTHCRYLATMRTENGVRKYITFLDDDFMLNWGFGEDNCGNETDLAAKGNIVRDGADVKTVDKPYLVDIVGRYTVTIAGKEYDTVCVMDIESPDANITEQYLDKNGRTILWRRFNKDDWAIDHYKKTWSEQLPDNEKITVNGKTYVHWYDCITDYVL